MKKKESRNDEASKLGGESRADGPVPHFSASVPANQIVNVWITSNAVQYSVE